MYIALYLPRWKFTCHLFAQSLLLENPSTVLQSALILSSVYPDTFSTSFIQIHLQSLILLAPELFSTLTSVPGTEGLSRESYPGLGLPLPASEQHLSLQKGVTMLDIQWPVTEGSDGWYDCVRMYVLQLLRYQQSPSVKTCSRSCNKEFIAGDNEPLLLPSRVIQHWNGCPRPAGEASRFALFGTRPERVLSNPV